MANQYFENNKNLEHNIVSIEHYFRGRKIALFSDNGVFSKSNIDYGSNSLLKQIKLDNVKTVLDVGCGYGTIGISIASSDNNIQVDMIDVNKRALELTYKAIRENGLYNACVFESYVYDNVTSSYDLIVTNPPIRAGKVVVHSIILGAYEYLNDNGCLWTVIQKKQGAPSALKALKDKFREVSVVDNDKGYWIIKAVK